ncbi:MAG: hypothetical protein ABJE95_11050 [Byssovorax sp.]
MHEQARRDGELHRAQLHRVKYCLSAGDFSAGVFANLPPISIWRSRRPPTPRTTSVGFLATFNAISGPLITPPLQAATPAPFSLASPLDQTARPPPPPPEGNLPAFDSVILLKQGLNRVGHSNVFGDFEAPAGPKVTESRQWIILQQPHTTLAMDDSSTNQSYVLPVEHPRIAKGQDPRFDPEASAFGAGRTANLEQLDWHGNHVHELREGDVLLTCYGAFVYGLASAQEEGQR